jgi:hypothetical protein
MHHHHHTTATTATTGTATITVATAIMAVLALASRGALGGAVDRSHCAVGLWSSSPENVPLTGSLGHLGGVVDGPISGNGDMGLVVGEAAGGRLLLYVDSMQFHDVVGDTGQSYCGYDGQGSGKRGVGMLAVQPADASTNNSFAAQQIMANATISTTQVYVAPPTPFVNNNVITNIVLLLCLSASLA